MEDNHWKFSVLSVNSIKYVSKQTGCVQPLFYDYEFSQLTKIDVQKLSELGAR